MQSVGKHMLETNTWYADGKFIPWAKRMVMHGDGFNWHVHGLNMFDAC